MLIIRWLMFLLIGLPIQGVLYIAYPLLYAIWRIAVFEKTDVKLKPTHNFNITGGDKTILNGALLLNADDHGAFTMYGFVQKEGLELLQEEGSLIRRRRDDLSMNRENVSGDVVVAWMFANMLAERPASDEVLKKVVDTYVKNLGTLSYDSYGQGYVSARCANFGVNIANDSDFLHLTQPAAGPQFYTTSAVLASAYNKGLKYKLIFWAHWLLMGGWYWAFAPVLYTKGHQFWYVRDITMKSLYIHLEVFGPKWWITKPMLFITDEISTHENDLFYAMLGREIGPLPDVMNGFFSQTESGSSLLNEPMSDRMSAYVANAILKIKRNTRFNE